MTGEKFLISDIIKSTAKDGKPFFRALLTDTNGKRINSIMFDTAAKLSFDPDNGQVVMADYAIQEFNGQTQYRIGSMKLLVNENIADFLPRSKYRAEDMLKELNTILIENLSSPYLIELVNLFMSDTDSIDKFKKYPAAKSVHHAYVSGLLEHTLSVVRVAEKLGGYYKDNVNKEILIIGALFHDIGKIFELCIGAGFEYTDSGKLLGHITQGALLVQGYINQIDNFPEEAKNVIVHLILSHHGLVEYGAVQVPKTTEAVILHHIDDMDAKMNTIEAIFDRENIDSGWSNYDRLMERQLFKHS